MSNYTKPLTVVEHLAGVKYPTQEDMDSGDVALYVPSMFSLDFINFIKLVNGTQGESHKSPVVHFKMLDTIADGDSKIINMCHRGMAKTTVMGEYLFLYLGVYGELPDFADKAGFGKVDLALYVSDSIENGVKNMRKNLEYRWENSEFLQDNIPNVRFTDIRWEFNNTEGNRFIVKGYGAKALSLDTKLYTPTGFTSIGEVAVGDRIYGADGKLANVTKKSEVFNKPMFRLVLDDGRTLDVSEDHINSIIHKENVNNSATFTRKDLYTHELLELPLLHSRTRKRKGKADYVSNEDLLFIENCSPLTYPTKELPLDPYTLGLLLGDGSMKKDGSNVLHAHVDDMPHYLPMVPHEFGSLYLDKRNGTVQSQSIKGLSSVVRELGVNVHGDIKFIPDTYLTGSIEQRLWLLKGLLDTDGSISPNGRIDFCSNSELLVDGVTALVRSLGGVSKKRSVGKAFRIEIWIEYVPFHLPRKAIRFKNRAKPMVAIKSIKSIEQVPSQCIAIDNDDHQFIAGEYFRTHNTGVRGAKEMGKRPQLAVLDDLVSDEDARSATVIETIEATVNKAVNFALDPARNMTIWSGTPFNARDPLYKAVETGAWTVNVFPVCEAFPVSEADFRGSWPDRFPYSYVLKQYDFAVQQGKAKDFNQELMLSIMSDEDRLVTEGNLNYYNRTLLAKNKQYYNFYITTDFATSEEEAADYSVISVWAYNNVGDWLWVDGICKRQDMGANVDDLFRLARKYKPQQVGVEVSGQQGGFLPFIRREMQEKQFYFTLASDNNKGAAGIRPVTNKLARFHVVVPLFKMGKIYYPEDMLMDPVVIEHLTELRLASANGFKSLHDDCIDTISMLSCLTPWRPSVAAPKHTASGIRDMWDDDDEDDGGSLNSYIV